MLTTHEIEDILDRFRVWLQESNEELHQPAVIALAEQMVKGESANGAAESKAPPGLLQIVESFTALRHEFKLQTKGLRGLQEDVRSNQQTVNGTIDEFCRNQRDALASAAESADAAARPLIMGLLDIDEAIGQAVKSTESAIAGMKSMSEARQELVSRQEQDCHEQPRWKRAWSRFLSRPAGRNLDGSAELTRSLDESETLEGLRLIQSRIRRLLSEAEVEPMQCIGSRVEPRTMRVLEVVEDPTQHPETVVDEIRTGYQWRGKTLRPAEVRATKSEHAQSPKENQTGVE